MKINLIEPKEILDFENENNLTLVVTEKEIGAYTAAGMPKFVVQFEDGGVEVGKMLTYPIGSGNTVNECLLDYCKKISFTTMRFPFNENKVFGLSVPKLIHTKTTIVNQ